MSLYTYHASNAVLTDTDIAFDLVVRDARDVHTFGGKRVTVAFTREQPLTEAALRAAIEAARDALLATKDGSLTLLRAVIEAMNRE